MKFRKILQLILILFIFVFIAACSNGDGTIENDTDEIESVTDPTPTAEAAVDDEVVSEQDVVAEEEQTEEPAEDILYYLDASLEIEQRVEDLLGRMTLEEKIGQMTLVEKGSINEGDITRYGIGALLSGGGGYPNPNTPEAWLEMVNGYQEFAMETRLAIPLL